MSAGTPSPMTGVTELLAHLTGARVVAECAQPVLRVHTDTRTLAPGDLFVALRGERFDAHTFLPQARALGAVAVVAERGLAESGLPGVEVPDSRQALGELARLWRKRYTGPLVAVTGSNGKTTVTQMVASILRAAEPQHTHATQGNLNNDIGVPLTLLRLRDHHRLSVVELGMNHPGEIAGLADMAQPTVALVNNAQREHQEFMGTVEAVARENGAVLQVLSTEGTAVFPSDDDHTPLWRELSAGRRVMTFSDRDAHADVLAESAQWQQGHWQVQWRAFGQSHQVRLHIAGRHNVRNAMAAAACALAAGVSVAAVQAGLEAFEPVGGRSRALALTLPDGRRLGLVDDTYNANPDSVRAAIDVLAELPGPRWLALGDMGEVGEQGLAFHLEVLRHARDKGIDAVHVSGDWMRQACEALRAAGEPTPTHWNDVDALAAYAAQLIEHAHSAPTSWLVKGSRFMRMERVVQALQAAATPAEKDSTHVA